MSKLGRKIRRQNDKMIQDLFKKMTKPDEKCDECTECMDNDECFLTCKALYARNKERYKSDIDKVRNITGDARI